MLSTLFSISLLSLFSILILFNVLLMSAKPYVHRTTLSRITLFAFIAELVCAVLGYSYSEVVQNQAITLFYPQAYSIFYTMLTQWFPLLLLLSPAFLILFFLAIERERKMGIFFLGMALASEVILVLSTIFI